jgi:hypothetical protein
VVALIAVLKVLTLLLPKVKAKVKANVAQAVTDSPSTQPVPQMSLMVMPMLHKAVVKMASMITILQPASSLLSTQPQPQTQMALIVITMLQMTVPKTNPASPSSQPQMLNGDHDAVDSGDEMPELLTSQLVSSAATPPLKRPHDGCQHLSIANIACVLC